MGNRSRKTQNKGRNSREFHWISSFSFLERYKVCKSISKRHGTSYGAGFIYALTETKILIGYVYNKKS